jgi:hypothetical protein
MNRRKNQQTADSQQRLTDPRERTPTSPSHSDRLHGHDPARKFRKTQNSVDFSRSTISRKTRHQNRQKTRSQNEITTKPDHENEHRPAHNIQTHRTHTRHTSARDRPLQHRQQPQKAHEQKDHKRENRPQTPTTQSTCADATSVHLAAHDHTDHTQLPRQRERPPDTHTLHARANIGTSHSGTLAQDPSERCVTDTHTHHAHTCSPC